MTSALPHAVRSSFPPRRECRVMRSARTGANADRDVSSAASHAVRSPFTPRREGRVGQMAGTVGNPARDTGTATHLPELMPNEVRASRGASGEYGQPPCYCIGPAPGCPAPRLSEVRVPCGVVGVDEQQFGPRHRHGRMSPRTFGSMQNRARCDCGEAAPHTTRRRAIRSLFLRGSHGTSVDASM